MTRWMNESNVQEAVSAFRNHDILGPAAVTLANLVEWTNSNSDGWPYWRKPSDASAKLQDILHTALSRRLCGFQQPEVTADDVRAAYVPIKAFRTRFARARGLDAGSLFQIVPLDAPRCRNFEEFAAWRTNQPSKLTMGEIFHFFPVEDRARLARYVIRYQESGRRILSIGTKPLEQVGEDLLDAIDLAADQDRETLLTNAAGKVIAAIVPVEQAERGRLRV